MAGRTNFPPTIPVTFAVYDVKTWEFVEFQSDLLLIFTVHYKKKQNTTYSTFTAQCGFS